MASRAAIMPSATMPSLLLRGGGGGQSSCEDVRNICYCWLSPVAGKSSRGWCYIRALASQPGGVSAGGGGGGSQRAPPGIDTRIHWENEDEGWIGGGGGRRSSSSGQSPSTEQDRLPNGAEEEMRAKNKLLGEKFSELLNNSTDSHYQFLGVSVDADLEEIKFAYRRLSKEYHPDTTSLPLKAASDMFMKLREVYDVLSDEEKRRFYDWTLAQEAASREAEKMRMKLEDPYMKEVENWESIPDMVDRLGGRNMELSDQAKSALTFDIFIIIFAICCIIYAIYFKEPY